MGTINVEGIGTVQIQGDQPTPEEAKTILKAVEAKKLEKENIDAYAYQQSTGETYVTDRELTGEMVGAGSDVDKAVGDFLTSPEFGRLVLEIGGGVLAAGMTGGASAPITIGRIALLSRPFLSNLARRSAAAGVGGGGGSAVATATIDPKDDMVKEVIRAAIENAAGEGIGGLAVKGIQKAVAPGMKLLRGADDAIKTIEEQREIIKAGKATFVDEADKKVLEEAAKKGFLTPGLVTDTEFLDQIQNVVKSGIFGSGGLKKAEAGAETIAKSGITDFVDQFIITDNKVATGKLIQESLSNQRTAFDVIVDAQYKKVDDLLGIVKDPKTGVVISSKSPLINTTPYHNLLDARIKDLQKVAGGSQDKAALELLEFQKTLPYNADFSLINQYRQKLLQLGRSANTTNTKNIASFTKEYNILEKEITGLLENAAVSPEAKKAFFEANRFYREGLEDFNNTIITKLTEKRPDLVFKELVRSGGEVVPIQEALKIINKRAVTPALKAEAEQLKLGLKGELLKKAIGDATELDRQYIKINANKLEGFLGSNAPGAKPGKYEDITKELFTKQEYSRLLELQNALKFSQGKLLSESGPKPGAMFFQFAQAGAIPAVATAVFTLGAYQGETAKGLAGASLVLATPKALGWMLTNPRAIEYLTKTVRATDPTIKGSAFKQLIAHLGDEGIISQDESKRIIGETDFVTSEAKDLKSGKVKPTPVTPAPVTPAPIQTSPRSEAPVTPTSPPANIFAANTPGTPMTTGVTPTAQPMDKAQQYAGLFPFDVAGQQIARRG
jgi:hypothetical protein